MGEREKKFDFNNFLVHAIGCQTGQKSAGHSRITQKRANLTNRKETLGEVLGEAART